uniref:cytochrome c oxidase subunit III n=1 Tax=Spelaeomysis bottazzii TaxID=2970448 RepID=UPI002176F072|nr:cytochrome c oxidase subunit III [Spelaeomysis bottazzii]UUL70723.1 cytochrome c oxidase subunit III [Spelaeomysis bottazzii]
MLQKHNFHMVDMSPWPVLTGMCLFGVFAGLLNWFYFFSFWFLFYSLLSVILICIQWWRDVIREATYIGCHVNLVMKGLQYGMVMFISSEVLFFFGFFWTFFHSFLSPTCELGMEWPPLGVNSFDPEQVPLLNSLILLSSGVSVTWAHHSMLEKKFEEAKISLLVTVMLGMYFTLLQMYEYYDAQYSISDSIFGACFFVATGFHGLHVIIGTLFLSVMLYRLLGYQFSSQNHVGFESSAWYWHFVDVVWLFLYVIVYWWTFS